MISQALRELVMVRGLLQQRDIDGDVTPAGSRRGAEAGQCHAAPVLVSAAGQDVAGHLRRDRLRDDALFVAHDLSEAQPCEQLLAGLLGEWRRLVEFRAVGRAVVGLQGVDAVQAQLRASGAVAPHPSATEQVPLVRIVGVEANRVPVGAGMEHLVGALDQQHRHGAPSVSVVCAEGRSGTDIRSLLPSVPM